MAAPPGATEDRGPAAMGIYWTQAIVAMVIVSGRFYARNMIRALGADDWWMLVNLFAFLGLACVVTHQATLGGFRHFANIDPENLSLVAKNFYIMAALGTFSFGTGKISVGCLILRLLPPASVWFKRVLWITILLTGFLNGLDIVLTFVQCNPPRTLWEPNIPHSCWDASVQLAISYAGSSYNIFVDALLGVLPAAIIWKLKMSFSRRLNLSILLGLGILAAICGIVKIMYLGALVVHDDITWDTYQLIVWSGAEVFVIIVCGSTPPLKPLWDRWVARTKPRGSLPFFSQYGNAGNGYMKRGSHAATQTSASSQDQHLVPSKRGYENGEIIATTEIEITSMDNRR